MLCPSHALLFTVIRTFSTGDLDACLSAPFEKVKRFFENFSTSFNFRGKRTALPCPNSFK